MADLNQINLSEQDFDMIIAGLDALPEKGLAGEMLAEMVVAIATQGEGEQKNKYIEAEMNKRKEARQHQRELIKDDVMILQGKLLMLKRYLKEQGALTEAVNILNHVK